MELKLLCALQGVSGREEQVRAAALKSANGIPGVKAHVDKSGNVIAVRPGRKKDALTAMCCAHMDEVGLMVNSVTDDGLLGVCAIGGVDPRVLVSKRVHVGASKLPGVIGAMAIHLQTEEDRKRVLGIDKLHVDIGAKDKAEAEKLAPAGSYITFDTPFTPFGDGLCLAKALDDRVGVYNLLRLLKNEYDATLVCAFTTQEEVGCRGVRGAAYSVRPDAALILEGTTSNDMGDIPQSAQVCAVGGGVAISFMDNASIARTDMFRDMIALAEREGIAHQIKRSVSGGNEGGAVQRSNTGVKTCVLSVPCRYIHSPSSVCSLADVEAQYLLAKAYIENMK